MSTNNPRRRVKPVLAEQDIFEDLQTDQSNTQPEKSLITKSIPRRRVALGNSTNSPDAIILNEQQAKHLLQQIKQHKINRNLEKNGEKATNAKNTTARTTSAPQIKETSIDGRGKKQTEDGRGTKESFGTKEIATITRATAKTTKKSKHVK